MTNTDTEIDQIMKEIEDLEQKMDSTPTENLTPTTSPEAAGITREETSGNVIPFPTSDSTESMVETDGVPVQHEPLMKNEKNYSQNGNLALKVGGCAEVTLEFEKEGMTVTFQCTDTGLVITTDQGAEFKIPFTTSSSYRKIA